MQITGRIIENTLDDWVDRKISGLSALEKELIDVLGKYLYKETKRYVPRDEGYLEESPLHFWKITDMAEGIGLNITWTGELNPNRWEMFTVRQQGIHGGNVVGHLDYALFQYENPMMHKKLGATDHFVDYGLRHISLDNTTESGSVFNRRFLEWLMK